MFTCSRREKRCRLNRMKKESGCCCCFTHDIRKLVFHHRFPSTRKFSISDASNYSMEVIREEVLKCLVVCRACRSAVWTKAKRLAAVHGIDPDLVSQVLFLFFSTQCVHEMSTFMRNLRANLDFNRLTHCGGVEWNEKGTGFRVH